MICSSILFIYFSYRLSRSTNLLLINLLCSSLLITLLILLYQIHQILLSIYHQSSTTLLWFFKLVLVGFLKLCWDRHWLKLFLFQHLFNVLILLFNLTLFKCLCSLCTLFQCVVFLLDLPCYVWTENQKYSHNGSMSVLLHIIIPCEESLLLVQKPINSLQEINRLIWFILIRLTSHNIDSSLLFLLLWLWLDLFQYLLILIFRIIVVWFHSFFI